MLDQQKRYGFISKDIDHYAGQLEVRQDNNRLGNFSHLEVVLARADEWETTSFTPVIKDSKLFAKGTLEDKGPTLMIYFAIKILKNLGYHLSQPICLILGIDEENSWQGVAYYFKKNHA